MYMVDKEFKQDEESQGCRREGKVRDEKLGNKKKVTNRGEKFRDAERVMFRDL